MVTPNFSSAATTTSTMESESTSRSSVKDLSSWTSPASMPVTSLTMSARSARISSVLAMSASLLWGFLWMGWCESWVLRDGDDLGGVRQAGAERDQQGRVAALRFAVEHHLAQRQRD